MLLNEIASKPSLVYLEYIFVHKASMNGTVGMGLLLGGEGGQQRTWTAGLHSTNDQSSRVAGAVVAIIRRRYLLSRRTLSLGNLII